MQYCISSTLLRGKVVLEAPALLHLLFLSGGSPIKSLMAI